MEKVNKILVIGAGGLGCEIVKLLKILKKDVTVLDFDTISLSNLNRQFYYTKRDENHLKAKVLAEKVECGYVCSRIEEIDKSFLDCFDTIFSCVDNVAARMEINYRFIKSKCKVLIDAGVEGYKAHAKRVNKEDPCLYCINSLYYTNKTVNICSLKGKEIAINTENKMAVIKSMIVSNKDVIKDKGLLYSHVLNEFNSQVDKNLKTTVFEIQGIDEDVVPNICTINSIAASLAIETLNGSDDFIFANCDDGCVINKIKLVKDPSCFVCKEIL